jgi:hypothetical protein
MSSEPQAMFLILPKLCYSIQFLTYIAQNSAREIEVASKHQFVVFVVVNK